MTKRVNGNTTRSKRLVIAQVLAGISLAMALAVFIAGPTVNAEVLLPIVRTSVVTASIISSIVLVVLSVAAFILSLGRKSFLLAGLLATSGILFLATPMTLSPQLSVMGDPSARIVYVAVTGLPVLGLGAAKAIGTARQATLRGEGLRHDQL